MQYTIALTGKKQSGKSTAAKYLEKALGAKRHNFKDELIAEIKEKFPDLLQAVCYQLDKDVSWLFEYKPPVIRTLMQNYGTNVIRAIDDAYWIKKWLTALPRNEYVVCDDVRFLNEAEAVRSVGGVIIRVVRDGYYEKDGHISETEMDDITPDYTIRVKTGDIDELHKQLSAIIERLNESSTPLALREVTNEVSIPR